MTRPSRRRPVGRIAFWSVGLVLLALGSAAQGADAAPGVVVEEVTARSSPGRARLTPQPIPSPRRDS
jgi:hypothetical protein